MLRLNWFHTQLCALQKDFSRRKAEARRSGAAHVLLQVHLIPQQIQTLLQAQVCFGTFTSQVVKSVFTHWWDIFGLSGGSGKVGPLLLGAKRVSAVPALAPAAWRRKRWGERARFSQLSRRPLVLPEFRSLNCSHRCSAGVNSSRVRWWGNRSSSLLCPWLWPRLCTPVCSCRRSEPAAGPLSPEGRRRHQMKACRLTLLMLSGSIWTAKWAANAIM